MKKEINLFDIECKKLLWASVEEDELVGLTSEEIDSLFEKNHVAFEQLLEMLPKMVVRTTVWRYNAIDDDDETGSWVENIDDTLFGMVMPADYKRFYLNKNDELILETEFQEGVAYSRLRGASANNPTIITVRPRLKLVPINQKTLKTFLNTGVSLDLAAVHEVLGNLFKCCELRSSLLEYDEVFFEEVDKIGHEAGEIAPVLMLYNDALVTEEVNGIMIPFVYGARLDMWPPVTVPHVICGARKFEANRNNVQVMTWHVLSYRAAEVQRWLSDDMMKHLAVSLQKYLSPDMPNNYPLGAMREYAHLSQSFFMVPQELIQGFHSKFPTRQRASLVAAADVLHCSALSTMFKNATSEELAELSAALR